MVSRDKKEWFLKWFQDIHQAIPLAFRFIRIISPFNKIANAHDKIGSQQIQFHYCIFKNTCTKIARAVGHNCKIGRHAILVAQVGLSGSVTVEDGVVLAGQAGVAHGVRIGAGAVVVGQAGVAKDVRIINGLAKGRLERAAKGGDVPGTRVVG